MRTFIFIVFAFWATTSLFSQDFTAYLQLAKERNPEIKANLAAIQSRRYLYRGAHSGFFPQVSADLSYSYRDSSFGVNNPSNYGTSLDLSQNIFNGGRDVLLTRQRSVELSLEEIRLEFTLINLSYDLQKAFADYQYAHEALELTQRIVTRRKDNLSLVGLQYEGGRENKGSVSLADAYFANAEYQNLLARNTLEVSRFLFARILGVDVNQIPSLPTTPIQLPTPAIDDGWLNQHPNVRTQQLQVKLAHLQKTQAASQFLPSLNFNMSYGLEDTDFFPTDDFFSLSLLLSVPLFRGGQNYYALKSAGQLQQAQAWTLQNLTRQLTLEMESAQRSLQEVLLKLSVDEKFQKASTLRSEIARVRYNNGLLTFDNWDIIENDLIQRQTILLETRRNVILRKAELLRSLGRHLFL